MLDIDHFKRVNDHYGHATGDQILRIVAERMARALRRIDLVDRHGGDEFAAVLPECAEEAVVAVAERLVREISAGPLLAGGTQIAITVSVGAAGGEGCADIYALLQRADDALYQAKAAGRNRVVRFAGPA